MAKRKQLGAIIDGTTYKDETPPQVVRILENARNARSRICLRYGDVKTGRDWGDRRECGRVGRSTGSMKIPLLIKTSRSMGGGSILDHVIIQITEPGSKRVLYQHPKYHDPRKTGAVNISGHRRGRR